MTGYRIETERQQGGITPGATIAAVFNSKNECVQEFGYPFAWLQAHVWVLVQFLKGKRG